MSTDSVPNPAPDWRTLLLDLLAQTGGAGSVPIPRRLVDLSGTYPEPLASLECRSIDEARALARYLAPATLEDAPALAEGELVVCIHIQYRGWWLMVGGSDPAPEAMAVAAACLTPDALPYVSGDLGDR